MKRKKIPCVIMVAGFELKGYIVSNIRKKRWGEPTADFLGKTGIHEDVPMRIVRYV